MVLADFVPRVDDLNLGWYYIADGTLLPVLDMAGAPRAEVWQVPSLRMKVILACTINGRLM